MFRKLRQTTLDHENAPIWHFMHGGRFRPDETAFREHFLKDDLQQSATIIYIGFGFMLALTLVDLPAMFANPSLWIGATIRFGMMGIGLGLALYLKRAPRPRSIDLSALGYSAVVALGILAFHLVNEPSATRMGIVVTFFIFVINLAFPTYATFTLLPILAVISTEAWIFFMSGRIDLVPERGPMLTVYLATALTSALISAHLQRARYHAFRAVEKVRTLSGMLPICAACKKIRDDDGFYQQIENYIEAHSEAEFSHGLCPDCSRTLYPELQQREH